LVSEHNLNWPLMRKHEVNGPLRRALWESPWLRKLAEQRDAEPQDRAEWLAGIRNRLGLVVTGEPMPVPEPPYGVTGEFQVIWDVSFELGVAPVRA